MMRDGAARWWFRALAGVCVSVGVAAAAQPTELDPAIALADTRRAYREGVTSERLVVSVGRLPGGLAGVTVGQDGTLSAMWGRERSMRRDTIVLRSRPGTPPERADAKLLLEMGDLRAVFAGGVMAAVHARNPAAYYRAVYEPPLTAAKVAAMLPPTPAPQFDLILGDAEVPASLSPYAERIVWRTSVVDDAEAPVRIFTRGKSATGEVVLITAARTGRVLEFACEIGPADETGAKPVLSVAVQAAEPGPDAAWAVGIEEREAVESLRDLSPRPADLTPGRIVAGLSLMTADNRPWTLTTGFAPAERAGGEGEPEWMVLILWRERGEDPVERPLPPALRAAESAVRELRREMRLGGEGGVGGATFRVRPVMVADLRVGNLAQRVEAAGRAWSTLGAGSEPLWTASPATTMDRFAPDQAAVLVVIDRGRRLRGVTPLTPESTAASVRKALEEMMLRRDGE